MERDQGVGTGEGGTKERYVRGVSVAGQLPHSQLAGLDEDLGRPHHLVVVCPPRHLSPEQEVLW